MIVPGDFHFAKPWMAALLLFTPFFYIFFRYLDQWRKNTANQFAEANLREPLEKKRSSVGIFLKKGGFLLAWVMGVIALMDPQGNGYYPSLVKVDKAPHEVILLIDVSASMGVEDTRLGISRLSLAKEIAVALLGKVKGDSIAVDVWTSELDTLVPETIDTLYPRLVIKEIGINEGGVEGTNLLRVFSQLKDRLEKESLQKSKTTLLFTDGGDTLLEAEPSEKREEEILESIKSIVKENSTVSVVGVGSLAGGLVPHINEKVLSKVNVPFLKKITAAGEGRYFDTEKLTPTDIAEKINNYLEEGASFIGGKGFTVREPVYRSYFKWPLSIALFSIAVMLLAPQTRKGFVFFSLLSFSLHADYSSAVYSDAGFFSHAETLLEEELQNFSYPEWKKNILLYNKGTNLLRAGETDQSVDTFESVLTTSPLLLYRLNWNLSIASFLEGIQLKSAEEAIRFLQLSSSSLVRAQNSFCLWQKWMGKKECPLHPFNTLSSLIESALSDAYIKLFQEESERMTKEDTVLLLKKRLERENTLLSANTVDPDLPFILEEEIPLWNLWLNKLSDKETGERTFKVYQAMVSEVKKHNYPEALKKGKEALLYLDQYLATRPFAERLLAELRLLREKMLFACLNGVTAPFLLSVKEDYEALLKNSEDSTLMNRVWNDLEEFRKAINHAWEGVQKEQENSCFFMKEAEQFLEDAILHLTEGEKALSFFLEEAVRKEEQAKELAALLNETEPPSIVLNKQNEAIRAAESFVQAISTWQKEHFRTGDEKQLCLHKPWDEVIPLYQEGLRQAVIAKKFLSSSPPLLQEAMQAEHLSIKRWEEALEKMKVIQEETKEDKEQAETEVRKDQVAETLQKMEQMDRAYAPQKVIREPGERPW